jgi:hypothetical protein
MNLLSPWKQPTKLNNVYCCLLALTLCPLSNSLCMQKKEKSLYQLTLKHCIENDLIPCPDYSPESIQLINNILNNNPHAQEKFEQQCPNLHFKKTEACVKKLFKQPLTSKQHAWPHIPHEIIHDAQHYSTQRNYTDLLKKSSLDLPGLIHTLEKIRYGLILPEQIELLAWIKKEKKAYKERYFTNDRKTYNQAILGIVIIVWLNVIIQTTLMKISHKSDISWGTTNGMFYGFLISWCFFQAISEKRLLPLHKTFCTNIASTFLYMSPIIVCWYTIIDVITRFNKDESTETLDYLYYQNWSQLQKHLKQKLRETYQ